MKCKEQCGGCGQMKKKKKIAGREEAWESGQLKRVRGGGWFKIFY